MPPRGFAAGGDILVGAGTRVPVPSFIASCLAITEQAPLDQIQMHAQALSGLMHALCRNRIPHSAARRTDSARIQHVRDEPSAVSLAPAFLDSERRPWRRPPSAAPVGYVRTFFLYAWPGACPETSCLHQPQLTLACQTQNLGRTSESKPRSAAPREGPGGRQARDPDRQDDPP